MESQGRTWVPGRPIDLAVQLGALRRGSGDPTWATTADGAIWRTTRTPEGPGLERLSVDRAAGSVQAQAWGPGAQWLLERIPRLLGDLDDPSGFTPPPCLVETHRRYPGLRVGRSDRVLESVIGAILEQRVTGKEAWRTWRLLVKSLGEPPPGPANAPVLSVFPSAERWLAIPSWRWHQVAVDAKRSAAVIRVAGVADQLEAAAELSTTQAHQRLRSVFGIGSWTAAETAQRALGDVDAVSYRDYHLAREVVYAFEGRLDGTDEEMERLIRPWAGHRYRVQRLVELRGSTRPRRGPRITIYDYSKF